MNNTENLLVIAMEEASEVQQAISKSLRFGLNHYYGDQHINSMQIMTEYYHLQAMIEELQKRDILPYLTYDAIFDIKKSKMEKVNFYNEESRKAGRLED